MSDMKVKQEKYLFKLEPFQHQRSILERCWMQDSYAFFMDMGTGKSKTFIDNAGILFCQQKIDGVLVVAPKGVYRNWSDIEIPKHFPDHLQHRVCYWRGTGAKKSEKKSIQDMTTNCPEDTLDFFIVNVEALGSDACWNACIDFINTHTVLMGIDESTIIKNYRAKRTKYCMDLGKKVAYRRIMSGFPITRNPLDLYSQCAFLDQRHLQPHLNGRRSVSDFKAQYAIEIANPKAPEGVTQIIGWKNLDKLTALVDKFSSRVLKSECLDLPPKTYQYWDVEMTPQQKKVYKELKETAMGELDGNIVSTEHMLPLITKLHQITCGHVKWDDNRVERIPNNRIKELLQIAEGIETKFIVWSGYEETILEIEEALVEQYGRDAVASYWGRTKDSDRVTINKNFENPHHPLRIFIGNPAAAGWGLTLVQAKTMIYYSNSYNLEHRMQSEDRFHRAGQTDNVTIIDMRAKDTLDEKIIDKLRSKINIAEQSLGDNPRDWLE